MLAEGARGSFAVRRTHLGASRHEIHRHLVLLWLLCLIGFCGIHRLYNGRIITGVIWLLTGGLLLIGQIIDLFLVPGMVDDANRRFADDVRRVQGDGRN